MFVPDDIAVILRSARVHRLGGTGSDIVVAMIDTGHYAHPFFNWHGYRVLSTLLGPGQGNPGDDRVGHGTGESANIFAAAPDIKLRPIKGLLDPVGDFNVVMASTPKPHIISNSWGYDVDYQSWIELKENEPYLPFVSYAYLRLLEATIVLAVADGITVCFSAGNGRKAFPGSHPDVISVGGVHVNFHDLTFEVSGMNSESIDAIRTTVQTLMAAGIDPMSVAVSLAALSVSVYKDITPTGDVTEDDMKMLFKSLADTNERLGVRG